MRSRKSGSTLATQSDAERLLSSGELVGVWPEGFQGIGKPFSERYRLQRFGRGGFVSAAVPHRCRSSPLLIVGAEEIYPIIGNMKTVARLLGVPYAPITPTWPLLGPLGLIPCRAKWLIEFGEPVHRTPRASRRRGPDARLRPHRPDPRVDPADPSLPAPAAPAAPSSRTRAHASPDHRDRQALVPPLRYRQGGRRPGRRRPSRWGRGPPIDDDAVLREKYWEQIPVILVDGRQHTFWRVDEARLRAALDTGAR